MSHLIISSEPCSLNTLDLPTMASFNPLPNSQDGELVMSRQKMSRHDKLAY